MPVIDTSKAFLESMCHGFLVYLSHSKNPTTFLAPLPGKVEVSLRKENKK